MVLEDIVGLLKSDLLGPRACVRGNQLLENSYRVCGETLDSDFATEPIVADNFHHWVLARFGCRDLQLNGLLRALSLVLGEFRLVLSFLLLAFQVYFLLECELGFPLFLFIRVKHIVFVPFIDLV